MLKKYKEALCGIFLIVLAIGLFILSFGIKSVALNLIKADFFPRLCAALFLILGLIQTGVGLAEAKKYAPDQEEAALPFWKDDRTVSMLETLALIMFYILMMKPVGFAISTFLYLVAQMYVLTPKEKRTRCNVVLFVVISLISASLIYLLFVKVFYLMLPAGILHI